MKREFTIRVEISDETDLNESSFARVEDDGKYFVRVQPDGIPNYITFAHEMGHVIGAEFKLPHASRDYRLQTGIAPFAEQIGSLLVASENEAWGLAEIALRVRDARTYAVGTYEAFYKPGVVPPTFYPYNK